jgi:hypothetical protein
MVLLFLGEFKGVHEGTLLFASFEIGTGLVHDAVEGAAVRGGPAGLRGAQFEEV